MSAAVKATRNSLPGTDDITRVVLPNGITVLARPNFSSLSVVVTGYLAAGSLFDTDEKLGLAHFTGLALMRGTAARSFNQIYDALESVGASLGFGAGVQSTGFNAHALAEDLPLLLDLLSEAVRQPVFPTEQVERLRAQLLTGLAIRAQDTQEMSSLTFDQIVFADHPYHRPEDGFVETIQAIKGEDLAAFHRRHYGPRRMVVVVVGAVDPGRAVEQVERALGSWVNPEQPDLPALPQLNPLKQTERKHIFIPGKSQADIVMGSSGPGRRSPDFISASLGNNILGQFGMMGRIGDVVREQSGLAYYASSSLNAGVGPGSWEVSAGVNPANLDKAVSLIQAEILRFVKEPVSSDELSDSQANYIGRLPLSLESNGGVAGSLVNLERYELGLDYYRKYAGMVHGVTPSSILETARRYLDPEKLAIASAGPEGDSQLILRTGIDLIEIARLEEIQPRIRTRFLARVFTPLELAECEDQGASLSGRFAAKEAVAKALGCGIGPISWQEIEIQRGPVGEPRLQLYGKAEALAHSLGLDTWSVSISHSRELAVAVAVALSAGGA